MFDKCNFLLNSESWSENHFSKAFAKGLEFLQAFKKLETLLSILISFPFISCLEINVLKNWLQMLRFF